MDEGAADDNWRSGDQCHDCHDRPSFSVVEYIEWYSERLDGQRFSMMILAGDIREIRDVCTERMREPPLVPLIRDGYTRLNAVRPTPCVISARRTVCMSFF